MEGGGRGREGGKEGSRSLDVFDLLRLGLHLVTQVRLLSQPKYGQEPIPDFLPSGGQLSLETEQIARLSVLSSLRSSLRRRSSALSKTKQKDKKIPFG